MNVEATPSRVACPSCGASIRAGARYCVACGASVPLLECVSCGAANVAPAAFCAQCGVELPPPDAILNPAESLLPETDGRSAPPTLVPTTGLRGLVWRAYAVPGTRAFHVTSLVLLFLVYFSVGSIVLESLPSVYVTYRPIFDFAEYVVVVLFTLDYAANIYVAPNKRAYLFSLQGIVDLLAVAPSILGLFDLRALRIARSLRLVRLLRMFRVLKLVKRLTAGPRGGRRFFQESVAAHFELYFVSLFCVVMIAATAMYYAEETGTNSAFPDIPSAIWWVLLTISGIGSSAAPVTGAGRGVAVLTMLSGLALFALLVSIVNRLLGRQRFTEQDRSGTV